MTSLPYDAHTNTNNSPIKCRVASDKSRGGCVVVVINLMITERMTSMIYHEVNDDFDVKTDLNNYCIAIYRLSWCDELSNILTHFLLYYNEVNEERYISCLAIALTLMSMGWYHDCYF